MSGPNMHPTTNKTSQSVVKDNTGGTRTRSGSSSNVIVINNADQEEEEKEKLFQSFTGRLHLVTQTK